MRISPETLLELRKEFPYKWKVQTAKHWGCECVSYVDARQVMDLLDEVVGPQNWQDHYREVAGKVYCDLTIKVEDEWITKSDCGTASHFEAEKGQASDAFKRAAVKWGIGRFLYSIPTQKTKSVESGKDDRGNPRFFPADEQGQRIYNLTGYIENRLKQTSQGGYRPPKASPAPPATQPPKEQPAPPSVAVFGASKAMTVEVLAIRDTLGWSAAQLGIWLGERYDGKGWRELNRAQAQSALENLTSELHKIKGGAHAR